MFLERHGRNYYNSSTVPVLGYSQVPPLLNTLNSNTLTYDYSEEVVWRADRVEVDQTEFNEQGLTKYNADHDWACGFNYPTDNSSKPDYDLQTYIRGETSTVHIVFYTCSCSAPNFTPTELTLLHKNATSATISWTAVNATEADGYVVYSTQLPQSTNTTAVDVGNVTQYTLGGLVPGNTYNITVRAYQDLLGPESDIKSEIFSGTNNDCAKYIILCLNFCSGVPASQLVIVVKSY